ncbi:MAG: glycerol-3-phosphate dehydrogenase, partial [Alphaproteobacteria bacterium]|nr:glycerol-3-phosphate dehydrogenase [Alphaproteobacteria bacterium]
VLLVEASDIASATSSASSKLIHGGLRYLEQYEFRLVREALQEREVLLRAAPHIIWPLRFVLPHDSSLRPRWMIRLGLFLYDHLDSKRTLPGCEGLRFARHPYGGPLRPTVRDGFAYSDCWVEDSRMVVLSARDAADRGARVMTRTRVMRARREGAQWVATLRDETSGSESQVAGRALVNAAGPWVEQVITGVAGRNATRKMRLVKGSHIVVPRLYDGPQAYILQNDDRRIVFVIPYEGRFTLIGTTDLPFAGDPRSVQIDQSETEYLCAAVSRWFVKAVTPLDVVWSYSGVRPLYDDAAASASKVTRDYVLDIDAPDSAAPLLSVFGGKITTFRRLAEHAMEQLAPCFPGLPPAWTATAILPGGDLEGGSSDAAFAALRARHAWLDSGMAQRLVRAYGSRVERVIGDARSLDDMGAHMGGGLTERELAHLRDEEWARSAEDALWRRSKLGLHLDGQAWKRVAEWFARGAAA